ncbi:hypothetical protein IFM89_035089 [Coptis chinensis]|uniref:Uncharacterized protein n=1 Tax=Coptis chinensis TaxID=261450 RepID=A0A835IIU4_9MAGN|nr:hypothetical protein IFM89_035089 [Coptis chinensis]
MSLGLLEIVLKLCVFAFRSACDRWNVNGVVLKLNVGERKAGLFGLFVKFTLLKGDL